MYVCVCVCAYVSICAHRRPKGAGLLRTRVIGKLSDVRAGNGTQVLGKSSECS